ncbi:MAG: hydrogenase maturation nickel metallochaperone HypA [Planctomycetota bacterium]|nr:hydrogenase maturation nickel metallochaperone HypA [Planctomycetota bacterium]
MHELSIVETLISQVDKEVQESGQRGRVVRLDLVIGRLSGVNADSIRFAFELLSPDTPLAGAELSIEEPRAVCRCEDCGAETEIDELVASCPACDSPHVTMAGGQDLMLDSIELEEE